MAALRRVFGEVGGADWIETLPRRGYRYLGPMVVTVNAHTVSSTTDLPLALPGKPSGAVLPFTNLSGDPQQEYFADGMVEDFVAGLSRIKWLFVIARQSSLAYKGVAIDLKEVGRQLGVRYLVQGSVRKDGNRVRISASRLHRQGTSSRAYRAAAGSCRSRDRCFAD
jgi:TolB-like protein